MVRFKQKILLKLVSMGEFNWRVSLMGNNKKFYHWWENCLQMPTGSSWGRVPSERVNISAWKQPQRRRKWVQSLQTQEVVGNFPNIWNRSRVPMRYEPHSCSCSWCLKIFKAGTLGSKNCDPYQAVCHVPFIVIVCISAPWQLDVLWYFNRSRKVR